MADDQKKSSKDIPGKDIPSNDPNVKRPYATLDLKATEIKVTPIADKASKTAADAARFAASGLAGKPVQSSDVPLPAAASTYAEAVSRAVAGSASKTGAADKFQSGATSASGTTTAAAEKSATAKPETPAAAAAASTSTSTTDNNRNGGATAARKPLPPQNETVVVKKRGGFISHLAAGLIGGVLALSASEWALPQLGLEGSTSHLADAAASLERRLQSVEKKGSSAPDLSAVETRLANLEATAKQVPYLAEAQQHFIAETKATLASAASDSGAPEYIERLAKLEGQLKALADSGANNPNAGRLEQLAALTGKVSDLETSLQTQLTALRKSVTDDVEARMASARESSEAAKSGTQRIDKDMATVKTDTARLNERVEGMKQDADRLTEALRMAREEQVSLKGSLDAVKTAAAKPADISAAVAPVSEKIATLQSSLDQVVKADGDRRSNAERILLSLELQNLKRVIERGQKYAAELTDVQKIAGGKVDLAPLEKFKDEGVPALADLSKDFRATANSIVDAETEPAEGSVMDKLIAGAKSVVRVRKISHDDGDKSAEAVVGRMQLALNEGRLGDVVATSKELSQQAQDAAKPFLDKLTAKLNVDNAVAALENDLKSSLNSGGEAAAKATQ